MEATTKTPGFYVAHHPWLDNEHRANALFKVGHTGDLRRRLDDDAYVTCFPPGWKFVYTFETRNKLDAHRLETGVLDCAASRRIQRPNKTYTELVHLARGEIVLLAEEIARRLGIRGVPRESPTYTACKPLAADKSAAKSTATSKSVLTSREKSDLSELVVPAAELAADLANQNHDLDDLVDDLLDGFPAITMEVPPRPVSAPVPRKTAEDYLREARAALAQKVDVDTVNVVNEVNGVDTDALDDLMGDDVDFVDGVSVVDGVNGGDPPYEVRKAALEDRAYQAEATKACLEELQRSQGRAILQMACRCGKTKVAHGVICDYLRRGQRPRVLYLVPGLALLRQTAQKLDCYGFDNAEVLLVGSDDRPVPDLMSLRPCAFQSVPAGTTDPAAISDVCSQTSGRPLLVVSTYQSSPLLPDCFDLTVFDESHRVCGERRIRPFTHVLLNHTGEGHRLYMTATPRYDATLSMKDSKLFGGVAYAYHMRQGIDAGHVNDFSLELVGRAASGDAPSSALGGPPNGPPNNEATPEQIVAAMGTLNESCGGVGKLLVFCRSIRHATELCEQVSAQVDAVVCLSAHSRMPRENIAANLSRFCAADTAAILFNCRLFQEGVEIPPLNGIFFASPRHSPRDIIQSLCRPLNVMPGKPPSKVFIPIAVDPGAAPDDAQNLERFASIIPYFDALVAEDPLLYEHLLDPRGTEYALRWVNSAVCGATGAAIRYEPDKLLSAARRSVRRGGNGKTERLLRAARIPWEIGFAELQRVVTECGRYPKTTDCFMYGDAKVNFGQFYRYARDSYSKWKEGKPQTLEPHQLYALEALPGWTPYGIEGPYPWRETLDFLERWLQENDGVPPMVEINKGGYVGLEATGMERLSGTLTCINQSDGRDRKGAVKRPGSGLTLDAQKQKELDDLCARWGLRWRKERHPPPEGAPEGSVGSLKENDKGEYIGERTFVQEAFARFKAEWAKTKDAEPSEYVQTWFPGYPLKHQRQERGDVWARRKEVIPPRWRGRGKAAKTEFDATKSVFL